MARFLGRFAAAAFAGLLVLLVEAFANRAVIGTWSPLQLDWRDVVLSAMMGFYLRGALLGRA